MTLSTVAPSPANSGDLVTQAAMRGRRIYDDEY